MHNLSEQPREIATSLLRVRRNKIDISRSIDSNSKVIIYGCDSIGQELFWEIKDSVNVVAFIDRTFVGKAYENIPIYAYDAPQMSEILNNEKVLVIVTPMAYWDEIYKDLSTLYTNVRIWSVYALFALAENDLSLPNGKILKKVVNQEKINIDRIVVITTVYSLLLYILVNPSFCNTVYIFGEGFPLDVLERFKKYAEYVYGGDKFSRNSDRVNDIANLFAIYAKRYNIEVWGHDHVVPAYSFPRQLFHVIEDGTANYNRIYASYYTKVLDDGSIYVPMGFGGLVNKVYLIGKKTIPSDIKSPVEIINPKKLWNKLCDEMKKDIMDIFSFQYDKIHALSLEGRSIIFLTEPLYKNSKLTYHKQVQLIKEIMRKYDNSKVIIKPHPGDDICYEEYFPRCAVLRDRFPFELLIWGDVIVFEKYIAIMHSKEKEATFITGLVEQEFIDYYDLKGNIVK